MCNNCNNRCNNCNRCNQCHRCNRCNQCCFCGLLNLFRNCGCNRRWDNCWNNCNTWRNNCYQYDEYYAEQYGLNSGREGGELCVDHITEAVGGNQSAVSHQLKILKDNKIIKSRRNGQNVLYSVSDWHVLTMIGVAKEHLNCNE